VTSPREAMRALLSALLMAGMAAAHAADWQLVNAHLMNGSTVKDYVDASTLRQVIQPRVRYWHMTKYSPPMQMGTIAYTASRSQETVDCIARTVTLNSIVYYDNDGHPVGELRPQSVPARVVPGSAADVIREFVCRYASHR